jgi:hypothetical protein
VTGGPARPLGALLALSVTLAPVTAPAGNTLAATALAGTTRVTAAADRAPVVAPVDTTPVTARCAGAAAFLREVQQMEVEVTPDSLADWRTGRRLPACHVTAAGGTALGVQREATRLYERLPGAGWTRTPDPRDAPREASLRFRKDGADCLFNVNREALLFTDAETAVLERLATAPGVARYHVFVMCVEALPAAPDR